LPRPTYSPDVVHVSADDEAPMSVSTNDWGSSSEWDQASVNKPRADEWGTKRDLGSGKTNLPSYNSRAGALSRGSVSGSSGKAHVNTNDWGSTAGTGSSWGWGNASGDDVSATVSSNYNSEGGAGWGDTSDSSTNRRGSWGDETTSPPLPAPRLTSRSSSSSRAGERSTDQRSHVDTNDWGAGGSTGNDWGWGKSGSDSARTSARGNSNDSSGGGGWGGSGDSGVNWGDEKKSTPKSDTKTSSRGDGGSSRRGDSSSAGSGQRAHVDTNDWSTSTSTCDNWGWSSSDGNRASGSIKHENDSVNNRSTSSTGRGWGENTMQPQHAPHALPATCASAPASVPRTGRGRGAHTILPAWMTHDS